MNTDDRLIAPGPDLRAAFALLTRLPIRASEGDFRRGARAAWAFPIVGAALGAAAVLAGLTGLALGLPATLAALLALALPMIATGALHEDGLADCADGFWGGWDRSRRLEIMKDSQIGSYGTLALILSLAARWAGWAALLPVAPWAALAAPVLSRAAMVAVMGALPHARDTGLSHATGRPGRATMATAAALALMLSLPGTGWATPILAVLAALAALGAGAVAKAKIGGQTGDVLGATQQLAEIAVWLGLTALLAG